jgi:hypothetical protein
MLTAAQLIAFALREYLPSMPMTPQTFIQRALSVRGRKEVHRDREIVVLYENSRDPLVTESLAMPAIGSTGEGFAATTDDSVLSSSRRPRRATSPSDLISHFCSGRSPCRNPRRAVWREPMAVAGVARPQADR